MPSRSIVMPALLIILVGCASSRADLAQRRADLNTSRSMNVAEEEPAEFAHIACESDTVRLDTPVVRAHAEGVRVVFENPGGAWGFELHPTSFGYFQGMGDKLPEGIAEQTWTIPPGEVIVACVPSARSRYYDPDVKSATFTVVDPVGLFVSLTLECGFGSQFRFKIAAADDTGPSEVFRQVPGVQVSDELRKPGYPESPQHWPTFMVFRDDVAIARIGGPFLEGEWNLFVDACPGTGIEKS